jgi:hypothetical protein
MSYCCAENLFTEEERTRMRKEQLKFDDDMRVRANTQEIRAWMRARQARWAWYFDLKPKPR